MAKPFQFELVSPERLLFSEEVQQVDVPGSEGMFGVLADHAPLLATLRPGIMIVTGTDGTTRRLFVRGGFADVNASGLTVLAERAVPIEDLDPETISAEIRDAEEDLADAEGDEPRRLAQLKLDQLRDVEAILRTGA